jgi:hypothetical protein
LIRLVKSKTSYRFHDIPKIALLSAVVGVNVNLWHSGSAAFGTGTGHVQRHQLAVQTTSATKCQGCKG